MEPGEDPWSTVVRECREELGIPAQALPRTGRRPFFLTVTPTRGERVHTDVSLWYVLRADVGSVTVWNRDEFAGIRWVSPRQILAEPGSTQDPHLHRFTHKLTATH